MLRCRHLAISLSSFTANFQRFKELIAIAEGHPFTNFHEGLAAVWEATSHGFETTPSIYWLRGLEGKGDWGGQNSPTDYFGNRNSRYTQEFDQQSGFLADRFGHANRDHRALLEAQHDKVAKRAIEELLFELFHTRSNEGATFDRLTRGRRKISPSGLSVFSERRRPLHADPAYGFDAHSRNSISIRHIANCGWDTTRSTMQYCTKCSAC